MSLVERNAASARKPVNIDVVPAQHWRREFLWAVVNRTLKSLCENVLNTEVLTHIESHPAFLRISGFVNGVFAAWAPKLYHYYQINCFLGTLHSNVRFQTVSGLPPPSTSAPTLIASSMVIKVIFLSAGAA